MLVSFIPKTIKADETTGGKVCSLEFREIDTLYNFRIMPWSKYIGATTNDSIKEGCGILSFQLYDFDLKGTWKNNSIQQGSGSFQRGDVIYNIDIETNSSNKRVSTIRTGGKIIATEILPHNMSDEDIAYKLTDIVILKERSTSKEKYEKYMKNKIFYLSIPLREYSEIFEVPIIGTALKNLYDANIDMTFTILPINENKLGYAQIPNFNKLKRSDRGYLIQQDLLMEDLTDVSYYNYSIVGDSLRFKSTTKFALENCRFGSDNKLYGSNNRFVLLTFSSPEQYMQYLKEHGNDKFVFGSTEEQKMEDKTKGENYYMTSEELKEKYKTSLANRKPSFPGGTNAMWEFIHSNLQYPQIAQENGVQGRVILLMTVTRDGNIENIVAVRSADPSLAKAAIQVVKLMPKFEPGVLDGQFVDSLYALPITFTLN